MSIIAVIDLDSVKYAAASVGEKRTIVVTHKSSGRQKEFNNRTEFYGRNKAGGWLAEINKSRTSPFQIDEFTIEDVQIPEPIENTLHTAKLMVDRSLNSLGTNKHIAYVGKGDSFRVERSTLLKYKGNREGALRALSLEEVTDYLSKRYKATTITHLEADDVCVMESYKDKNKVIVGVDKDYYGFPVNFFNSNRPEEGVVDCRGFGSLWIKDGKVRGKGRIHHYWQIISEDSSDNYKANCFSDIKWASKSAYKSLKDCSDDKEAFCKMVEVFKHLYPTPKEVVGWRGDVIKIDWFYVMKEMFDLSRMLRYPDDVVNLEDVLNNYGISVGGE